MGTTVPVEGDLNGVGTLRLAKDWKLDHTPCFYTVRSQEKQPSIILGLIFDFFMSITQSVIMEENRKNENMA